MMAFSDDPTPPLTVTIQYQKHNETRREDSYRQATSKAAASLALGKTPSAQVNRAISQQAIFFRQKNTWYQLKDQDLTSTLNFDNQLRRHEKGEN